MANPDEQSKYTDPELEALLADAPPDTQQTVREIIKSLQSNLSAEEWTAIRRTFVNDLLAMQEKRRLEQELVVCWLSFAINSKRANSSLGVISSLVSTP
jgi:hypothetical protein